MSNLIIEEIKGLHHPEVLFYSNDRRFEGIILAVDDTYVKFHDAVRCYTRFIKIDTITDLEVKDGKA